MVSDNAYYIKVGNAVESLNPCFDGIWSLTAEGLAIFTRMVGS